MKDWLAGYLIGLVLILNSLLVVQPLAIVDLLLGVFIWFVLIVNWYARK